MKGNKLILRDIWFILLCTCGGFLLSLTGMSIGWMIGTLMAACFFSFLRPAWSGIPDAGKGVNKLWLNLGQLILGVELGQKLNGSVVSIFLENWLTVTIMLILSIGFALLTGLYLYRFSQSDILTSFVGTAPGGMSAMPGIAQEVGANTATVTLVQTIRVLLVVLTIPILVFFLHSHNIGSSPAAPAAIPASATGQLSLAGIGITVCFFLIAWAGAFAGKKLRIPARWLLGSMLAVAITQVISGALGFELTAWWPHGMNVISQLFLGASIGSRFHKEMFRGVRKTLTVAFTGSIGFVIAMLLCALVVSKVTGISLTTSILAFSPGGIAEMASTSVALHADSTFVVTVQVLRLILVIAMLPPLFRFLHLRTERVKRKKIHSLKTR
ncbi:AbrB family transcriptional regulator [Bacillus gobiensis]|uniref:AbrB family transcriptional regulator n=1 Tax=Bacillus gobiensis TaxID=1441095 RepID=UPI003D21DAFD